MAEKEQTITLLENDINILGSTGFVGRNSLDVELKELPLRDAVRLWRPVSERMSAREKLDMLSDTGGVPKYLEEVRPSISVDEKNIRRMCFMPDGILIRCRAGYITRDDGRLSPRIEADRFFDFIVPAEKLLL